MYTSKSITGRWLRFLAIFLFAGSCGVPDSDRSIREEYAKAAYRLGLTSVYPPREDFQVGDILLTSYGRDPKSGAINFLDGVTVWVSNHAPLIAESEKYLNSRLVFDTTSTAPSNGASEMQEDLIRGGFNNRGDVSITSLPIVAYPEVVADAGVSTGTAISRVFGALGLSTAQRTRVSLNFNDVRNYGIPLGIAARKFSNIEDLQEFSAHDRTGLKVKLDREAAIGNKLGADRCLSATLITRVLLTRSITYTYSNAQIQAGALRENGTGGAQAPAPVVVTVTNATGAVSPAPSGAEIAKIVEQVNSTSTTAQGIGLSFVSWDALGLTLERRFQRPVAIAWEGMSFPPQFASERQQAKQAATTITQNSEQDDRTQRKGITKCY